jgi:hypothetical protein
MTPGLRPSEANVMESELEWLIKWTEVSLEKCAGRLEKRARKRYKVTED